MLVSNLDRGTGSSYFEMQRKRQTFECSYFSIEQEVWQKGFSQSLGLILTSNAITEDERLGDLKRTEVYLVPSSGGWAV